MNIQIDNLTKTYPEIFNKPDIDKPLELQLLEYCDRHNYIGDIAIPCILYRIILIKNVLSDDFYKTYYNDENMIYNGYGYKTKKYKDIKPFLMLITEINFVKYIEYSNILLSDKYNGLLFTKLFDLYDCKYDKLKEILDSYLNCIITLYCGFILYPNSKTQNALFTYYNLLSIHNVFWNLYKFDNVVFTKNIKIPNNYNNIDDVRKSIFELIQSFDIDKYERLYKIDFCQIIRNITKNYFNSNITKLFFSKFDYPNSLDIACNNFDLGTVLCLLEKNIYPTETNFKQLIDNKIINSLITKYHIRYYEYILDNLNIIIQKFYNYKILPEEKFIDLLLNILTIIIDDCDKIDHYNKHINNITSIVEFLVNHGYQISHKIVLLLVHSDSNVLKNIDVSEDYYYQIYKFSNSNYSYDKLCLNNFKKPLHIMRNMCFDKKTTVTQFKKFLKDNNIKPDRYCFEFSSLYNTKIEKWLIKNNCLPTINSLGPLSKKKQAYLKILSDAMQTQEYMCQSYNFKI
ncbi:hypothetical protein Hokovirus_3_246 [Hokovirus HKV1]|uniref:Uncharacterized protein n=1 Tax=Hokovirus HKV1 TaxID=1977638 RepID=A0A1V0SGZ0_9VIRU|nr:hypothetical protein Hokovirus_3_246 [Hokovirus HKV1]